jgi:DNA sulfur modification protein DndD
VILDELVLHNFGVYRGRQTFNLSPTPGRPIILVGAQNGAGKTTFLEGLQLAFFGRLTAGGFRGATSYDDYLRQSINRNAPSQEGAEVQVSFRRASGGVEQLYTIRRAWSVQKGGVREVFEAVVDGKLDRVLTEHWAEFVEEMLPPRIAPLFFFDGEKIEQFADLQRSSEIIGRAISALLGLDIVERLQLDLDVLQRRKTAGAADATARAELAQVEAAVEASDRVVVTTHAALAASRRRQERQKVVLERARTRLKAEGGDLFAARESLFAERKTLETVLEGVRKDLRDWAAGPAPLLLVRNLLADVANHADKEAASQASRTVLAHLVERDQRTLTELESLGATDQLLVRARAFFDADRDRLSEAGQIGPSLELSNSARSGLHVLLEDGLAETDADRGRLLEQLEGLEAQRDDLERRIASIPAAETVAPWLSAVAAAERVLAGAEAELAEAERQYEAALREQAAARAKLQDKLQIQVDLRLAEEDTQRTVAHVGRVQNTLREFRAGVVRHHVHRIERLIIQGLTAVMRKPDLVADVQIHPDTFEITLRGGGWDAMSPDQLSAGERQLFAVALLWALAKASGQAVPTVIDTPLGRLDSVHRGRLVERYFPQAGDQVILLSTDEEIDARLYERLEPAIARSYTVVFDADSRGSQIKAGYAFATNDGREAA